MTLFPDGGSEPPTGDEPRHFLDIDDLSAEELAEVLTRATDLKERQQRGKHHPLLAGQSLGMIFEKPSTRTRVSFETGMTQLGGHALFLGPDDIQLGHGEPVKDTARALSRYVDALMARMFDHADVAELAEYATVPVINGLTDAAHPCQTLADLLTVREELGGFDASVAWIGDGNNVCRSLIKGAALVGLDLTVATPTEFRPGDTVLDRAAELGAAPEITDDPKTAVADADLVYTDVWVSMGQEEERDERMATFREGNFQVDRELLGDRGFMHCLPATRGEEVTDGVMESPQSLVWQQAENRLHAQKGLLAYLKGA